MIASRSPVSILGVSGFAGTELARLVAAHPSLALASVAADRWQGSKLGDHARDKLGAKGVVVLGAAWEGKATLLVSLTPDLVAAKRLHAGDLVKALAARAGGRGGGKPNTAQAGLPDLAGLEPALAAAVAVVQECDRGA